MELNDLKDLYIEELKDLYSAENQILKALPKMIKNAANPQLKAGFEEHLNQTQGHVQRLQQIFDKLGEKPTGKMCHGMQGVIEEGQEMIKEDAQPEVKDAGLISAAQHVEHYEMAGYGTVVAYAKILGENDAMKLLQQTLQEEEQTDKKLTDLAMSSINIQASQREMAGAR